MGSAPNEMRAVGPFRVFPLCLGGNVFGWTASEREAREVLDSYVDAGGNFVDTADSYSHWAEGHVGGESEKVLGEWLSRRGCRDEIVLTTKVGSKPGRKRLDRATMRLALDESLARLRTDFVDIWMLHRDDRGTPLEETVGAVAEQHRAGKVRAFGVSNFTPARIEDLVRACLLLGAPEPIALQAHYNLMDRDLYERELAPHAERHGLAALPYFSLAHGFLTGKYRIGGPAVRSPRRPRAAAYLGEARGTETLRALDSIARDRRVAVPAIALAWLAQQPTVAAPIASARNAEQLQELLPMASLALSAAEIALLSSTAAPSGPRGHRCSTNVQ